MGVPADPSSQLLKRLGIGAVIATGIVILRLGGSQPGLFNDVPAVPALPAVSVPSPGSAYLETMRQQYFAQNYTDQQLLAEGYKVCNAHFSQEQLLRMVQADMGVSLTGAAILVGAAQGGLGC
ncbi:Protein of uncharacterised function (DUF732) [Mycobacteroides abscessus subsp. abscessus]|nr:Protein of uncharacterised function (DUF732) [Mycobacteroides abscessus subsp. abscessus]